MNEKQKKLHPPYKENSRLKTIFCAIRTVILRLILFILSAIWLLFIVVMLPFPWRIRSILYRSWCYLSRFLARYICGIRYKVIGLENIQDLSIKSKRSVVYVCNHQSAWETVTLPGILSPLCYVLKKGTILHTFFWMVIKTNTTYRDRSFAKT